MTETHELPNLDLLRATAVLLVVGDHLAHFWNVRMLGPFDLWNLGRLGVLFFFVHTSLVLMMSLQRRHHSFGEAQLWSYFIIRRIFRIYPLSVAAVLLIVCFRIPSVNIQPGRLDYIDVGWFGTVSNLLLTQNLTYTDSILGPLWSLPYEMQMYLVLPAMYLFAQRAASVRPVLVLWGVTVAAAIAQPHIPWSGRLDIMGFVPCFVPGVAAFKLLETTRPRLRFVCWPAILLVFTALFALVPRSVMSWNWLICLITGIAIPHFRSGQPPWLMRISHAIAKYSYGVYLSHCFCIWLAFIRLGHVGTLPQWIIFAVASAGVPVVLYHALEQPMIRFGGQLAARWTASGLQEAVPAGWIGAIAVLGSVRSRLSKYLATPES